MTSDNRSLRQKIALHRRARRLLSTYIPYLFTAIAVHSAVAAWMPYVHLWLFSCVLSRLALQDADGTWLWVGITLMVQAVLILTEGLLRRWKEAKWERLYRVADRIVTDKLLSLDHAAVDDHDTREHLDRVREHTAELDRGLVQLPQIVQYAVTGLCGLVGALSLVWSLFLCEAVAAIILLVSGVIMVAAMVGLKFAAQRQKDSTTQAILSLDRLYGTFFDTVFDRAKAADVRLYRQDTAIENYLTTADRTFFDKHGLKRQTLRLTDGLAGALTVSWLVLSCLPFVALETVGMALCVRYSGALMRCRKDVQALGEAILRLHQNTPFLQTALEFSALPSRLYQGSLTTEKRRDRDYELTFRHVSYRYPAQEQDALCNICVTLRPGSRIAVVGENGSGKSTFVKLLCRLYDPTQGDILLNGIDIRKYRYAEYMQLIAVVLQDFRLPDAPLAETVASGAAYDPDRVAACLENAGLELTSALYGQGLNTPLRCGGMTANGVPVSVGDAQKIAIARALYKNAPFLILDEPTAALDSVTEADMYANLDRIAEDKTTVYVSHRLSGCRFCEEILVFDRGRIVQRGTHEELLRDKNGKYHALWCAQAQYYQS